MAAPKHKSLKIVSSIVSSILKLSLTALIIKWLYDLVLLEVFNTNLTYNQWLTILVIFNILTVPFSFTSIKSLNDK